MSNKTKSLNEKYSHLSQREHILKRPNMYISSIKTIDKDDENNKEQYIYEDGRILLKHITYNDGLNTIIKEITSNASDHSIIDKTCNEIKINVNNKEVSVYNNGDNGIEVELYDLKDENTDEIKKIWVPELLFCVFNTSSSYNMEDNERITNNINGIGAKATCVFSKYFNVEVLDMKRKKLYKQTNRNNLEIIEKPIIIDISKNTKYNNAKSYTKITFQPDFEKFGLEEIPEDFIKMLYKKAIDISFCTRKNVKVYFNNELINIKDINDYVKLYYPNDLIMPCIVNNNWEFAIVYNKTGDFKQVSFTNNNITPEGGSAVDYILKKIIDYIKKNNTKIKNNMNITPFIKSNISLFVKSIIPNPEYTSQTKTKLKSTINNSDCIIPENYLKMINKSDIIKDALESAEFKQLQSLKKTDGKKVKRIDIDKYTRAQWAGTSKSNECRLIITEGDSASTFALKGLDIIGHERFGVFPIRGKMLNTRDATPEQIQKNQEITKIKQILGLKQNIDYSDDDNFKQLNYGGIIILTDQDLDGSHIKGLVINFIHSFWRELLMRQGFIQTMLTPIIRVSKGNEKINFYYQSKYEDWAQNNNTKGWKIKYYKGLGGHNDKEIAECFNFNNNFNDEKLIDFIWEDTIFSNKVYQQLNIDSLSETETDTDTSNENKDENKKTKRKTKKQKKILSYNPTISDEAIDKAFSKDRADDRKEWLINMDKNNTLEATDLRITYSDFIDKDLIFFSDYDNVRSIPSICDGFKPSQRKIFYTILTKNYNSSDKEVKVSNLANETSQFTNYLHGEVSLAEAIIGMAQQFVGSNNINILNPDGTFGSRRMGGKDAAATRYIFTYIENIIPYIFRKEDNGILKNIIVEGDVVEPETYYPIIPMCLINGVKGIGTGFSTNIPMFNPKDIINIIKKMLNDEEKDDDFDITPWYRFYKGNIDKVYDSNGYRKYITHGIYEANLSSNQIHITELPINIWTDDYVSKFIFDKKTKNDNDKDKKKNKYQEYVNYVDNFGSPDNIDITLTLNPGKLTDLIKETTDNYDAIEDKLGLTSTISLSNMVLHDENNILKKYNILQDIFVDFYNIRIQKYKERKNYYKQVLQNEIDLNKYRIKFIEDYINGIIKIYKVKEQDVIIQLDKLGYPKLSFNINDPKKDYSYLTDMKIFSLTEEKMEELTKKKDLKEAELKKYINTSIKQLWLNELNELEKVYDKWNSQLIYDKENFSKKISKPKRITKRKI